MVLIKHIQNRLGKIDDKYMYCNSVDLYLHFRNSYITARYGKDRDNWQLVHNMKVIVKGKEVENECDRLKKHLQSSSLEVCSSS